MAQLFANAARSTLTASIISSSTQLQINPADQALFPVATGADWFKVSLEDSSGNLEYMRVQRAVGQSLLTITERATEDATKFPARSFVAGSLVELRMTAADLASSIAHPSVGTGAHAATAISVTPAGGISGTTVQEALQELDAELASKASTGANTFTGHQTLPGNATDDLHAIPRQQLRTIVGASFKALALSATGLNSNVSVAADEVVLRNSSGDPVLATDVAVTVNAAATGAGGLDTGALAGSTWYSVWLIWNGSAVSGLLSASATTPTMPAGYTHKARVGWIRTDGTVNKYPLSFNQRGRRVRYEVKPAGNLSSVPIMASGLAGNPVTPTWVPVTVSSFVPPTASMVSLSLRTGNTGSCTCAPNNAYGGVSSTTNPAPASLTVSATTYGGVQYLELMLESSAVYWASDVSTNLLACLGWEDNL